MLCPECMTPLETTDGVSAVCPAHPSSFRILFTRTPFVATATRALPRQFAPMSGGSPMPAAPLLSASAWSTTDSAAERLASAFGEPAGPVANCMNHPGSPAVSRCFACKGAVCATCVFVFPGGLQFCPSCASNPNPKISRKRTKMIWWSAGLGVFSLLALASSLLLVEQLKGEMDAESLGMLMIVFSVGPGIVGLSLGLGARDKRLRNPGFIWVGVICNGLTVGIWILLMIVGLMR